MREILLRANNLSKSYKVRTHPLSVQKKILWAVNEVNLEIRRGELLGLVGESGCGKSTLGRLLLLLERPDKGKIWWKDTCLTTLKPRQLKKWRRFCQPIFQDPFASLNPRQTIKQILEEPLVIHGILKDKKEREKRIIKMLREVGLPAKVKDVYPHELSGGQRQRIAIARALILEPELIIADEPTSALDVSVQAQIVNLLLDIQKKKNVTYLFISHNLALTTYIADRIGVMYMGRLVEIMERKHFKSKHHPYTMCLWQAIPSFEKKVLSFMPAEPPDSFHLPTGCAYHPRCAYKKEICTKQQPILKEIEPGHFIACHLYL